MMKSEKKRHHRLISTHSGSIHGMQTEQKYRNNVVWLYSSLFLFTPLFISKFLSPQSVLPTSPFPQQFEKLQARAVSYFFEVVTVIIVTMSFVIITGLHHSLTLCNNYLETLGFVVFLAVHMAIICSTGQRFTDKVRQQSNSGR